ncbi:Mediator complex, subunit Med9 [Metarhizium rileyi]|uniref:Mediator of RNA polymerase II transcription subunit 9 n=1 Tax=Metarhizium rileyi (strain RCEF 4871) TaxID=1649241 RepID=A0A167FKG9_METRR|nr:Mediator complex, subunit Med9 [Metarhizium rileyi RCEF 4871]TWU78273.1 hypothetical protein ED733_008256 [Metarhizium rileyi]
MAAEQHPLALPPSLSPDDLDALSELSIVLAKVRAGLQSSNGLTTTTSVIPGGVNTHGQQLSFKDVPGATDGLKHKLQHARAQVRTLPDMDRSIEEQNREIRNLQARIKKQRGLLATLRDGGVRFSQRNVGSDD